MENLTIEKNSNTYLVKDQGSNFIFSEHETYFEAAISLAMHKQGFSSPPDYWIVDEYLMEGFLGGKLIGEIADQQIDPSKALIFTQDEFDRLLDAFKEVHGHYPDS